MDAAWMCFERRRDILYRAALTLVDFGFRLEFLRTSASVLILRSSAEQSTEHLRAFYGYSVPQEAILPADRQIDSTENSRQCPTIYSRSLMLRR
ncbi:unnamed protein product [Calypogeia fissa]